MNPRAPPSIPILSSFILESSVLMKAELGVIKDFYICTFYHLQCLTKPTTYLVECTWRVFCPISFACLNYKSTEPEVHIFWYHLGKIRIKLECQLTRIFSTLQATLCPLLPHRDAPVGLRSCLYRNSSFAQLSNVTDVWRGSHRLGFEQPVVVFGPADSPPTIAHSEISSYSDSSLSSDASHHSLCRHSMCQMNTAPKAHQYRRGTHSVVSSSHVAFLLLPAVVVRQSTGSF